VQPRCRIASRTCPCADCSVVVAEAAALEPRVLSLLGRLSTVENPIHLCCLRYMCQEAGTSG